MRMPAGREVWRWSRRGLLALGALVFLLLAWCALIVRAGAPRGFRAGNRPEALAAISAGGVPFRFAVLGDSQKGLANTKRLLARLRGERADFQVHTGDLVSRNDDGHYQFLLGTLAGAHDPWTVVVPGNHDVKGGADRFEGHFGPTEFSFGRGDVLFVVLNNALSERWENSWLEGQLRSAPGRRIVLFLHVPPFDTTKAALVPSPGWEGFTDLCRRYKVAYVFCGHAPGYSRLEDRGTVYIANGIGGDSGSWQFGGRVAATVVEVGPDSIRDRTVEIASAVSLATEIDHLALGHVGEAFRRRPFTCWSATVLLAAAWVAVALRRPGPRPVRDPPPAP